MDVKSINPKVNNLTPGITPEGLSSQNLQKTNSEQKGPSFAEALNKLNQPSEYLQRAHGPQANLQVVNQAQANAGVKFSNHAIERMRTRGVSFTPEDLNKLSGAVQKAAAKGSKDSLVLMNDTALIVSVKNNTVVTVVDKNSLKENVFTNIDSTIVM